MPPKKANNANAGGKAAQKAKQKVVEDKTFGLKNKNKSAKVQKYVQQVQSQATTSTARKPGETKKELELKRKEEMAELFKPVQIQKVPFGVDPKTIVCQFYKAGTCTKGKSCKFSHDTSVERKSAKIDLYTDARDDKGSSAENGGGKEDNMEDWDQAMLEEAVQKKHGRQTTTEIVCKYFIQAVEDRKYGWFWQCPNGETCKYRHALPPGFVLKDHQKNKKNEDEVVQTLEEWIEEQRSKMPSKLTPVTLETFNAWVQRRQEEREKSATEKAKQREAAIKAGKSIGASGRELFTYNPEAFNIDDDDEAMEIDYTLREEDEGPEATKIDASAFEGMSLEDLQDEDEELE